MRKSSSRKSSISTASTYITMGDFWDSHDLSDFWDKTHPARATVRLETEESYYGIEKGLSQTICKVAKEKGISPHTLINLWVQEKIRKLKIVGRG